MQDIMRMFNSAFNEFAKKPDLDLYPEELRANIDAVNEWVRTLEELPLHVSPCWHGSGSGSCTAITMQTNMMQALWPASHRTGMHEVLV